MNSLRSAVLALLFCALAACSSVPRIVNEYKIDIQQGNVITQEQIERVKPGMNRLQVRDMLGTPLLTDAFHPDRWDYVFTLRQGRKPLQRRNVVLVFEGDVLKTIDAPELPTDSEFIDSISRGGRLVAASALELTPEQLKALPIPAQAASQPAAAAPPPSPPRNYPPLEPS